MDHIWTSDGSSKCSLQLQKSPDLTNKIAELFNIPEIGTIEDCNDFESQKNTIKKVAPECKDGEVEKALREYNGKLVESLIKCLDKDTPDLEDKQTESKKDITYEEFVSGLKATGNMPENATEAFLRKMYNGFHKDKVGSGSTLAYNWEDDNDTVIVYVPIPTTAKKNAIKSKLTTTTWKLTVDGKDMIDGQLYAAVKADDSYWAIETPGMFCMTLEKVSPDKTWEVNIFFFANFYSMLIFSRNSLQFSLFYNKKIIYYFSTLL